MRTWWNHIYCTDSRRMDMIPDSSVSLVVTSPPYNVGKPYELHPDNLPLPEYMEILRAVWAECRRVLIPGGRLAINVAGLWRTPYLPLACHITQQCLDLGYLMRGEIIWDKGASVGTSTAWGSWRKPSNPTLRDVHEYILVFSKERFDLPHRGESDLTPAEFTAWTKSIWQFPTVSAKKVGHPAPFPVELPRRLIKLYTYRDDIVLDPFNGSGSTCLAAQETGRRWVGIDVDPGYCALAEANLAAVAAK